MKYLRWYHTVVYREHPHKGSGYETAVYRPGTEIWAVEDITHGRGTCVWVVLAGILPAVPLERNQIIDHWPPREDE